MATQVSSKIQQDIDWYIGALEREWKVGHQGIGPDDWGTNQGIHLADDAPSPVSQNGSGVNSSDAHSR